MSFQQLLRVYFIIALMVQLYIYYYVSALYTGNCCQVASTTTKIAVWALAFAENYVTKLLDALLYYNLFNVRKLNLQHALVKIAFTTRKYSFFFYNNWFITKIVNVVLLSYNIELVACVDQKKSLVISGLYFALPRARCVWRINVKSWCGGGSEEQYNVL